MNWKRSTCGLLLGGSLCLFHVGCAAFNALVSSPAGNSAGQGSPERIAAIGRVFENQGKYAQAQNMYRRALSADPSNIIAQERLNSIASRGTNRSFESSNVKKQSMVAVADSLNARRRTKPRRLGAKPPIRFEPAKAREFELATQLAAVTPDATQHELASGGVLIAAANGNKTESVNSDAGEILLANPGWQIADTVSEEIAATAADVALTFAPAKQQADIATVGFEGNDVSITTLAAVDTSWKSADRVVSLDQLLEWSEDPDANSENLTFTLTGGEDDAVKAFAATLLAECSNDNAEINPALRNVCEDGVPLLRLSCRDTLIQRGEVSQADVYDLLGLMSSEGTDIRAQAAASLRNLAGSQWGPQCVAGLHAMLNDNDDSLVSVAAATLGDFGVDAVSCRSQLMDIAATSNNEQRRAAADLALNRIPVPDVTLPSVESTSDDIDAPIVTSDDGYLPIVE